MLIVKGTTRESSAFYLFNLIQIALCFLQHDFCLSQKQVLLFLP